MLIFLWRLHLGYLSDSKLLPAWLLCLSVPTVALLVIDCCLYNLLEFSHYQQNLVISTANQFIHLWYCLPRQLCIDLFHLPCSSSTVFQTDTFYFYHNHLLSKVHRHRSVTIFSPSFVISLYSNTQALRQSLPDPD